MLKKMCLFNLDAFFVQKSIQKQSQIQAQKMKKNCLKNVFVQHRFFKCQGCFSRGFGLPRPSQNEAKNHQNLTKKTICLSKRVLERSRLDFGGFGRSLGEVLDGPSLRIFTFSPDFKALTSRVDLEEELFSVTLANWEKTLQFIYVTHTQNSKRRVAVSRERLQ